MVRRYLFQKSRWAVIQGLIDTAGYLVFRHSRDQSLPSGIKKILVSRIDHLGDVFIASSIVPHLRKAFPESEIHFLAGEWSLGYLRLNPDISKVLVYNSIWHGRSEGLFKKSLKAVMGFFRNALEMRRASYDLCIDLRTFPCNSIPLLYVGKGRYRVGFSTGGFGFLLNKIIPYRGGVHETAHICDALRAVGVAVDEGDIRPSFTPGEAAIKEASDILEGLGITLDEPYALIHTGSGNPSKYWRKEGWREVAGRIKKTYGMKAVIFDTVYGGIDGALKLPANVSFEVFAALSMRASLFAGLDSLPAHLAASFGTPAVVIWCGINDPLQWQPVGPRVRVVKKDVQCAPCFRRKGCAGMECMDITPDDCLMEVARLLKPGKGALKAVKQAGALRA